MSSDASRQLLQGRNGAGLGGGLGSGNGVNGGIRPFGEVAQHRQPRAPTITRKSFERKVPLRHLLNTGQ